MKLVEKFLAQQVYEENPIRQATHLMEAIGEKKLEKLHSSTIKTVRRLSEQQRYHPTNYYFYQYEIEKNLHKLTDFDTKRGQKGNMEEIIRNLDYFYFAEKLRIYCSILSKFREVTFDYKVDFIEEIIKHLEENLYTEIPSITAYYTISKIYLEPENEEHYFKLKKIIQKSIYVFPPEEASQIYGYALNYCVDKANKGNQVFLREYFNLYQGALKNKVIFSDGELSPWVFKNIVLVALRLGEYGWTEKFISDYNEYIPESFRENAITYNSAQLYFYQKKYDEVISLLHRVEYEDLAYNLNSKLMLIAVYYETDEIEPLFSLFESFRVYLNRNKKFLMTVKDATLT